MEWNYESHRDVYKYPCCFASDKRESRSEISKPATAHMHYNIEIIYMIEGTYEVQLYDLSKCIYKMTLDPGEFIIINCNILHRTPDWDKCSYYLAYIPPDCLMPQLTLGVGETFSRPAADTDGQLMALLEMMANRYKSGSKTEGEPIRAALMNSLANAAVALMLPKLSDKRVEIRAVAEGEDVFTYVFKNFRNPELSAKQLSTAFGFSSDKLCDLFHDKFGVGVRQYITDLRINAAKAQLLSSSDSNETISRQVGFDCLRTFYRAFMASTGMTPTEFRGKNS